MKEQKFLRRLFLLVLFISISQSHILAQNNADKKIDLVCENEAMPSVLKKVGQKSGYQILFTYNEVQDLKVTVNLKSENIEGVMQAIVAPHPLSFKIKGKYITVSRSQNKTIDKKKITGVVVDTKGVPIYGVGILTDDQTVYGQTDINGYFDIAIPAGKTVNNISFSFLGMQKVTLPFDGYSLRVTMQDDVLSMKEVVVTGVVTKNRESFTGSSATFTADELKLVGTQNIISSLKTLDPSFNVLESGEFGSDPNRMPDIEIRGKSSLLSTRDELSEDPNQPLFILDGFESSLEAIYNLDMNRISSITILKDAASTAIYGSKAANGVVVVETIRPKAGKLNLSYNGSANISWADLTSYNLMNASEKLQFEKLAGRYSVGSFDGVDKEVELEQLYNQKLMDISRGVDTYWLAEPLQTGINHRHSLYATGGQDAFMFGIGGTYNGIDGVMKDSKREVISGNIDLTYRVSKFQFMNKFYIENMSNTNPIVGYGDYANASPYYTKYNDEGEVEKWLEYNDYIKSSNPLYDAAQNSYSRGKGLVISDKFITEYTPIPEVRVRARFGLTHNNTNAEDFRSPRDSRFSQTEFTRRGTYNYSETKSNKYEGELTLTLAKTFKDVHLFNLALGSFISQHDTQSHGYGAEGFPDGDFTLPSYSNQYTEGGTPSYYENSSREVSAYAIGNYAYDNRYLLDFSYRVNGSSVFGTKEKYIGTWALGLAWNLHREKFISDNIDGISMLKLRGSIGNPGNQNFSSSATSTTFRYNFNMYNYFGMTTSLEQLGNPNLKWQTTLDRNFGFDITVLDNRLTLVGDYYYKTTNPLLIGIAMPPSSGATNNTMYKNFGKQTSSGYTAQATYYIFREMDERFWWSVRGSLRNGKNELSGIGNRLDIFNTEGRENKSTKRYYDGADSDDIWAVRSAGIDPANGREIFIKKNGELTYDYSYEDEVIVANSRPKIEGILGTNFSWKGFSVNFDFRYRFGGYAVNNVLFNKVENIDASQIKFNQDRRALYDRWQKPGDIAQFKDISSSISTPMSSRFVQKDNSFTLESFRMGYEFSPETARKFGLGSIRLNAYMNEIFRISTIKMERGTSYPFARSVSFALSLTL